ncbi:unnamed protein product, partial [Mesorhabditis belari]|uniref:Uncharacterized protein n=1 Tax=Mesorhabditis belari TaxID=2138241 RepID=A0AAF3EUS5_9BILA
MFSRTDPLATASAANSLNEMEKTFFEPTFKYLMCSGCGKHFSQGDKVYECQTFFNYGTCYKYNRTCFPCMLKHAKDQHSRSAETDLQNFFNHSQSCMRKLDIEEKLLKFYALMEQKFLTQMVPQEILQKMETCIVQTEAKGDGEIDESINSFSYCIGSPGPKR